MTKILILGAGQYQVPLIKKAKEMGMYVIVCSIDGNYPGFDYADKVYHVDIVDTEAVLKIAKAEKIDAITTSGSDVGIPTLGKVCDEIGLMGVSYAAAKAAANKSIMKQKFADGGVKTAKFIIASNYEEALAAISELRMPVMIKAADLSGSRGITKIPSLDLVQIKNAVEKIKRVSHNDKFVVEECIEGTEFGAQAMVRDGKIKFIMPHGDYVFEGDAGVPVGHYVPFELNDKIVKDCLIQVELGIKALGIDNCAVNVDFILRDNEVYVLEIGARAGATCLPEMVALYYGIDFYRYIIELALGKDINDIKSEVLTPNVCKLLISHETGIIKDILIPQNLSDNVYDVSCDYKVGHKVKKFRIGPDRIGQVIVKGTSLKEAEAEINELMSQIKIVVE